MTRLAPLLTVALLVVSAPRPAHAQDPSRDSPAHISLVDGAAVLEREGRTESAPASMPLLAGDRIRTQNGRVEILFEDRSTLHLDTSTVVDFQSDDVIRVLDGRVRVNITNANGGTRRVGYRIDAPSAWVQISAPGEYRVSILRGERDLEVELAVLRGAAELVNEDGRTPLGAGERAYARAGAAPSYAYVFNSAAWDSFDRWSEARRDARLGVSSQYLPEPVQSYATTFADYGSWQYMPTYGYVWYPRVNPGWRPYYYGRWATYRPWGWTWIGSDPWAWPTHHYGRWGFSSNLWFWIPGRTWGPAWVSWAYAPGYVSWCPLGWNNRPVVGFVNVNVRHHNPWNAWTVVPHRTFGAGYVNVNVINSTRIDVRTRDSFVVRDTAPDFRGYAVPRSATAIRGTGTRGDSFSASQAASPRVGASPSQAAIGRAVPRSGTAPAPSREGASATQAVPSGAAEAAAAEFRSRRSAGSQLSGPGYPNAARQPSASRSGTAATQIAPPAGSAPTQVSPEVSSRIERRAVPRGGSTWSGSDQRGVRQPMDVPSRRAAPDYRAAPVPDPVDPTATFRRPESYRGVPRSSGPDNGVYAPPQSYGYGAQPERNPYRSPSSDSPSGAPRAVPRSSPAGGGAPPPMYRSMPGGDSGRSAPAPSGPPPQSAAPARPSGPPPSAGASSGQSRSGGGSQSTGRAVPRGRGGR
jgi:Family of unknown function (DUF6600)/FecR protein